MKHKKLDMFLFSYFCAEKKNPFVSLSSNGFTLMNERWEGSSGVMCCPQTCCWTNQWCYPRNYSVVSTCPTISTQSNLKFTTHFPLFFLKGNHWVLFLTHICFTWKWKLIKCNLTSQYWAALKAAEEVQIVSAASVPLNYFHYLLNCTWLKILVY